jgi:ABC-type phosphate transport system auxiliary subunit
MSSNIATMIEMYGKSDDMKETLGEIATLDQEAEALEATRRRVTSFEPADQSAVSARDGQLERIQQRRVTIDSERATLRAQLEEQMVAHLVDNEAHTETPGPRPVDDSDQESPVTGTNG